MQVSIETTSSLERRMTVTLPAAQFEEQVNERLNQAARSVRLPGFRPGKVPMKEVRRRFGPGVRAEVAGELMQSTFFEAVREEQLKPAGQPRLEPVQMDAGVDFTYAATFEVMPEIELGDLASIKVEQATAEVTEADIDTMIERLREQRKRFEDREDRAAVDGDQVVVSFEGFLDGEAAEGTKADDIELLLGSGRMIPGFEEALLGAKAGEERSFEVTFPEDYGNDTLKGKVVRFEAKVSAVREAVLPPVGEELFSELGVEDGSLETFRSEVRENMERELETACRNLAKNQVMDGLVAIHEVSPPKALVHEQIHNLQHEMVQRFGGQGMDPHSLPEELFREQAERRVRLALILNRIVEVHSIEPDAERVEAILDDVASRYQEPEQVKSWYHGNPEQMDQIRSAALEDAVVAFVLERATVTEVEKDYDAVLAAAAGRAAAEDGEDEASSPEGDSEQAG
ncbi:MAG: trigger factor [Gammaproteobacteria bacterium]|jgi:trigger factor|nr:trigger factor [Gammaproteobacteria bacterium]